MLQRVATPTGGLAGSTGVLRIRSVDPFQPEVMDVFKLMSDYHGRLSFHGGMSVQHILPFGTEDEVRQATQKLVWAGRHGGYVFAPSHAVPADVPPRNLVVMMEELNAQAVPEIA